MKKFLKWLKQPLPASVDAKVVYDFVKTRKKWAASTQLSYFNVILAYLKMKTQVTGNVNGAQRDFKLSAIAQTPNRVAPLTLKRMIDASKRLDMEHKTLLYLAWGTAARLTSITKLQRQNITFQQISSTTTTATITFRSGKTILATGPYTLVSHLPTVCANWILQQPKNIFPRATEQYYAVLRKAIGPIRGIRRGALQHLAGKKTKPEHLLLISRHTTMKSLYHYLDDGRMATWEHNTMKQMAVDIWTDC
jgi:integrase